MSLLNTALIYAGQGIPVYAATFYEVEENGEKKLKKPPLNIPGIQENGRYSATTDIEIITKIFSHPDALLIGMQTGSTSGIVVVDIDTKSLPGMSLDDIFDMVQQFGPLPETLTVETISGGRHLYYKCKDVVIGGAKFFDRKIPIDILADGSPGCVYAIDWINYIPQNCDTLDNIFDQMAYLPDWIKNYKKHADEKANINNIILLPETVRDIKRKLRYIDPIDYQTWIDTGMALKSTGADRQAYALWREWSEEYHNFSEKEARYKWKSFNPSNISIGSLHFDAKESGQVDYDPSKSMFKIYPASDLLINEPEPIWIVQDIIQDESISIFYGDSGCGKTWVCLDMIVCASMGVDWIGHKTIQSNCLIIDEESGKRRLKKRLKKILAGHNCETDANFFYMTMNRVDMQNPIHIEELVFFIRENNIKFVLIDALMEVIPGADENSVKDMAPPLMSIRDIISKTQTSVSIIHHSGKLKESQFRGSSAIKGSVDLMIKITKDKDLINMKTTKVRDVEDFEINARMIFTDFSFNMEIDNTTKQTYNAITKTEKFILKYLIENGISKKIYIEEAGSKEGMSVDSIKKSLYKLSKRKYIGRADSGGPGEKAQYGIIEKKKIEVEILIENGYILGNIEEMNV